MILSWKNIAYVVELKIAPLKAKTQTALLCARIFSSFVSRSFRYPWYCTTTKHQTIKFFKTKFYRNYSA